MDGEPKKLSLATSENPHIRFNPLKGEWVLVSPNRMKRPWLGQIENFTDDPVPEFDAENPLCPGVKRGNGEDILYYEECPSTVELVEKNPCQVTLDIGVERVNPNYEGTYIFNNDFPALLESIPDRDENDDPLFKAKPAVGVCKVMCFHPKSNLTMSQFSVKEITNIINDWVNLTEELGRKYVWVQIFENKGAIMGCSNPHPHCQIWASAFIPNEARVKDFHQLQYYKKHGKPLLLDYVEQELQRKERVVLENDDWVVVVPFWALWPFETMILPKTHIKRFNDLKPGNPKIASLASIMKKLVSKYDGLFKCNFPYTMGWHGAPTGKRYQEESTHWVFHGMYYPPLLRSATIKKFMVGYEMLAQGQRDMTPEAAAAKLRSVTETTSTTSSS